MSSTIASRRPFLLMLHRQPVTFMAVSLLLFMGWGCKSYSESGEGLRVIEAVRSGDQALALQLIGAGVDLDCKDKDGKTALMHAAQSGMPEVVRALINAPVNLDVQDKNGSTALILAANAGHPEVVQLLVDTGADKSIRDNSDWTAFDYANDASKLPTTADPEPFKKIAQLLR